MANLDLQLVRHALTVARENGFAEVELSVGDDLFMAALEPSQPKKKKKGKPADVAVSEAPSGPQTTDVKATLVGYYRPAKTPLELGMKVEKGDVVAVIAALGIANEIEATASGEIVEVLVEPNQPVEYGQVLARIQP